MVETTPQDWRHVFWQELASDLEFSDQERAVFFAICDGFTVAGQNLRSNSDHVFRLTQRPDFTFWGHQLQVSVADLQQVNFKDPKWQRYAGRVMNGLHQSSGVHPRSLLFLDRPRLAEVAVSMLATVQELVIRKHQEQDG